MDQNRYQVQFEKDKTALKNFLDGRNYYTALKVLGWIERQTHGKFRKDGVMPELHHMVRLSLQATQLGLPHVAVGAGWTNPMTQEFKPPISLEEQLICVMLLHDCIEDDETYDLDEVKVIRMSSRAVGEAVWKMTKKFRGKKKDRQEYINEIALDLLAALGKGLDREDNINHMIGVFSLPKIVDYTHEAKTEFLPMLKKASKLFPEHLRSFKLIMYRMKNTIKMLEQYIDKAEEVGPTQALSKITEALANQVEEKENELIAARNELTTRTNELDCAYSANQKAIDERDIFKERVTTLESELKRRGNLNPVEAVAKVMKIFTTGGVSQQHKVVLQEKLCKEFGVSHMELINFKNVDVIDGAPGQKTSMMEDWQRSVKGG